MAGTQVSAERAVKESLGVRGTRIDRTLVARVQERNPPNDVPALDTMQ